MLPCLNKKIFGVDCLGCGLQRSLVLLLKGDFLAAFKMYPAIYSLILLGSFTIFSFFIKLRHEKKIKTGLIITNILIIVISYIIKMNRYF